MILGTMMVAGAVLFFWAAFFFVWACLSRANDIEVSPEKPAGVPPADAVILLPDGEIWEAKDASWHVKAAGRGLDRRDWPR
jgi:hypothetical protein